MPYGACARQGNHFSTTFCTPCIHPTFHMFNLQEFYLNLDLQSESLFHGVVIQDSPSDAQWYWHQKPLPQHSPCTLGVAYDKKVWYTSVFTHSMMKTWISSAHSYKNWGMCLHMLGDTRFFFFTEKTMELKQKQWKNMYFQERYVFQVQKLSFGYTQLNLPEIFKSIGLFSPNGQL